MAFDDATRNRLSNFVTTVRRILTEEFSDQLRNVYGLDPDSGSVAEIGTLPSMAEGEKQTAVILRELLSHYTANKAKQTKNTNAELIDRIVREQSFTVLNRLCALRMAEARDLVTESVANGYQSKGFRLYSQLAGAALGETGDAYRCYLQSVFDELAVDLPALFDRFSEYGRLFPRESVLQEVLDEVNHQDLQHLWAEDETIGWIYQYFNIKEERKAMRDASQAPRNSRELAVRNQFFTPRYVVEFLTDNTLGRIWYEMRKGETRLTDECQYLVRRPNEIFLSEGDDVPKVDDPETEVELTQEELLNQPVNIPHRQLKDPREIRMLDPACGSMHFGLYAFDLYLKIYDEFWDLLAADSSAVVEATDLSPFATLYDSKDEFVKDVPCLIIEHNIHGIDIDPRAVQIAGLSLWLRAQRAWKSQGIASGDRPQVTRSNVVCAEPMPGDKGQLDSFCKQLHPGIAQMVVKIFEEMKLAGEAGSLLKIEQEVSSLVSRAREQWLEQPADVQMQLFGETAKPQSQQLEFDLSGITDQQFFEQAEETIYEALRKYASESSEGGFRRKLFAGDAEKGFAFVEVCQKHFDVSVMNPPFGSLAEGTKKYISKKFPNSKHDLYCCFIDRGIDFVAKGGVVGAITNRTGFFLSGSSNWREDLIEKSNVSVFADLGDGVLDDALVETAAYVVQSGRIIEWPSVFLRVIDGGNEVKGAMIQKALRESRLSVVDCDLFLQTPGKVFAYWIGQNLNRLFGASKHLLEDYGFTCQQGAITADDFRFLRLRWEVSRAQTSNWRPMAKGGDYRLFYSSLDMVIWSSNEFYEIAANANRKYPYLNGKAENMLHLTDGLFDKTGIFYTRRTSSEFSVRVLPGNSVYSDKGPAIQPIESNPDTEDSLVYLLGLLNSSPFRALLSIGTGAAGSAARSYETGLVCNVPLPDVPDDDREEIRQLVKEAVQIQKTFDAITETDSHYIGPPGINELGTNVDLSFNAINTELPQKQARYSSIIDELDNIFWRHYHIAEEHREGISLGIKPHDIAKSIPTSKFAKKEFASQFLSYFLGYAFGNWRFNNSSETSLFSGGLNCNVVPDENGCAAGILVGESGHNESIDTWIRKVIEVHCGTSSSDIEQSLLSYLSEPALSAYFDNPNRFFANHLTVYSKNRRSAPIYWPISTESGSYTLWFYYHRLTDQTLYKAVNDFVEPKLKNEILPGLKRLRAINNRSSAQEKELDQLTELESEVEQFKADLLEIAAYWKPNLNDGVQITAAPLWKLFRLTKWSNKLKKTWSELGSGKYDWAHLALSIWPDRVVREKCTTDRSIAIAHDVEDLLWVEDGKWRRVLEPNEELATQIERHSLEQIPNLVNSVEELIKSHGKQLTKDLITNLESGALDELSIALLLWPERVALKCWDDSLLMEKHGLPKVTSRTQAKKRAFIKKMEREGCALVTDTLVQAAKSSGDEFSKFWSDASLGEYDTYEFSRWLWPERVLEKCRDQYDLAASHGLERFFWTTHPEIQTAGEPRQRKSIETEIADEIKRIQAL